MFDWQAFHFIRPLWLLALLPLAGLIYFYYTRVASASSWSKVCDPHLLTHLLVNTQQQSSRSPLWLIGLAWLLTTLALAGPTWSKLEQPIFRSEDALTIVLDLSRSMDATDIKPSRLDLAKFKLIDLLKKQHEGKTALIVYAADPFVVSPLTNDADTIIAQIPTLSTELMPRQGSRADLALEKAAELMKQAGTPQGHILLITDGIQANASTLKIANELNKHGIKISVYAVGTAEGAPIPLNDGGFLKDSNGAIVIPQLNNTDLIKLSNAGGGLFQMMTASTQDIEQLSPFFSSDTNLDHADEQKQTTDTWQEQGPWLVLLLLPFAALAFRRGWLAAVFLVILIPPQPSYALDWQNLWQTPNQQAAQALEQQDVDKAAELFTDPRWQGVARYQKGDYAQAAKAFSQFDDAEAHYNRANALAKAGKLEDAIQAYDQALQQQPEHADAKFNRGLVETALKQQQQQQDQNSQNSDSQDQQSQQDGQQQDSQQSQQDSQQQNSQQQNSEQNDSQQSQSQQSQEQGQQQDQQQTEEQQAQQNAQEQAEKERAEREQQAAQQQDSDKSNEQQQAEMQQQENLSEVDLETQQAVEQWLRRIPDDPGGLLRRKFIREHQKQRANPSTNSNEQPW